MITEADTCRKCVLPKLYAAGSNDDQISEQKSFTDGRILVVGNRARRRPAKRADYLLRYARDEAKNLFCLEQTESIQPEDMELIFGRDFKLEAGDSYLFYAYEFRKFSLMARLIVIIGYGFGDVMKCLGAKANQLVVNEGKAKKFLLSTDLGKTLLNLILGSAGVPF